MLSLPMSKLINLVLYQLGWFSCVLGAAYGFPVTGAIGALSLIALHLLLTDRPQAEAQLLLCAALLGILIDSSQQALGVFRFKTDPGWPLWLPFWVVVVWAQFATLFRTALHWLSGRYLLSALLGLVSGPLAYGGGVRLGAAQFGSNLPFSLISLALVWALATPLLFWLSARLEPREGRYRRLAVKKDQHD